jgi:hypothetical protein
MSDKINVVARAPSGLENDSGFVSVSKALRFVDEKRASGFSEFEFYDASGQRIGVEDLRRMGDD